MNLIERALNILEISGADMRGHGYQRIQQVKNAEMAADYNRSNKTKAQARLSAMEQQELKSKETYDSGKHMSYKDATNLKSGDTLLLFVPMNIELVRSDSSEVKLKPSYAGNTDKTDFKIGKKFTVDRIYQYGTNDEPKLVLKGLAGKRAIKLKPEIFNDWPFVKI